MEMEQPTTPAPAPQPVMRSGSGRSWKKTLGLTLLAAALLALGAGAGWYYRDNKASDELSKKDAQISTLEADKTKLSKDLEDAQKASGTSTSTETGVAPSAATLDNIKASITSGNTAALEGYMASSVNVILAASEAYGPQTITQAISDLSYVSAGTNWDWNLPATTLAAYRAGAYKQYFPTTALVGKSSNKYVISFQFNASSKISGIFMTNNASLLE